MGSFEISFKGSGCPQLGRAARLPAMCSADRCSPMEISWQLRSDAYTTLRLLWENIQ